ncbi:hypothetical protein ACIBG8_00295 [Nonomuraea sp. NPDC050556]|uniref:hypothetical protein n=1 Tax=Nonomuraea sp. NPDC050556 TaxID=3364369 RepID=UPI00378DC4A2
MSAPDVRRDSGRPMTAAPFRRVLPAAAALRAAVAVPGGLAVLLALPPAYADGVVWPMVAVGLAVLAAALPRSGAVGVCMGAAVLLWLVGPVAYSYPPDPLTGFAVGALLYLQHSAAALAARLPLSTGVPAAALGGWALRAGSVVLGSGLLALAVTALPALPANVAVPLGAAGAVALTALTRFLLTPGTRSRR